MKETEIEKQLKEEQKILESIAEKKGNAKLFVKRNYLSIYCARKCMMIHFSTSTMSIY